MKEEQRVEEEERGETGNKQQDGKCKLTHNNKNIKWKGTRHSSWKVGVVRLALRAGSCLRSGSVSGRIQRGVSKL